MSSISSAPSSASIEQIFFSHAQESRDAIRVERAYIKMCGDHAAGLMLSQIVYWFKPNRNGEKRITITRDERDWLRKTREEWMDECCLTDRQADRCIALLVSKGFITKALFKYAGSPTMHLSLNLPEFLVAYYEEAGGAGNGFYANGEIQFTQTGKSYLSVTDTTKPEIVNESPTDSRGSGGKGKTKPELTPAELPFLKTAEDIQTICNKARHDLAELPPINQDLVAAARVLERAVRLDGIPADRLVPLAEFIYRNVFGIKNMGSIANWRVKWKNGKLPVVSQYEDYLLSLKLPPSRDPGPPPATYKHPGSKEYFDNIDYGESR